MSSICTFYLRGVCRYGNRCRNSHDLGNTGRTNSTFASAEAPRNPSNEEPDLSNSDIHKLLLQNISQFEAEEVSSNLVKDTETEKIYKEVFAEKGNESKSNFKRPTKVSCHSQKEENDSKQQEEKDGENKESGWKDVIQSAIDSDLQCNICFELFIKPTVLNCSHTFCETCIHVWKKRSNKCPICRVEILSISFCLTLNSFIEKIVERLPSEVINKRDLAIKERSKINIEKSIMHHRVIRDFGTLLSFEELMEEADAPVEFVPMEQNSINADIIIEESQMFRMNLRDTVVSTRGINPLMSYMPPEEQRSNRSITRPNNSSDRH